MRRAHRKKLPQLAREQLQCEGYGRDKEILLDEVYLALTCLEFLRHSNGKDDAPTDVYTVAYHWAADGSAVGIAL